MDTLVRMKADDINSSLVDFIKSNFKGKNIAVHIYEEEVNETDFILKDPVHREKILKTIEEVNQNKNLKTYTLDELKHMFLNEPEE